MTTYNFDESLRAAKVWEKVLDRHFRDEYTITHATPDEELTGIDRWFQSEDEKARGEGPYGIEYKTDLRAETTGNLFFETEKLAPDKTLFRSWAWESLAHHFIILIPHLYLGVKISPRDLQADHLWKDWKRSRWVTSEKAGRNWHVRGELIPIQYVRDDVAFYEFEVRKDFIDWGYAHGGRYKHEQREAQRASTPQGAA